MSAFGGIADVANFKIYGGGKGDVRLDFASAASRHPWRRGLEQVGYVATEMLPNTVGQAVTETDGERCGAQVIPTNRCL